MTDALQQRSRYQCALKNSSHVSDEKTLNTRAGWCDLCLTAEKSVPVRFEECTSSKGIPFLQCSKLRRLKLSVILFVAPEKTFLW